MVGELTAKLGYKLNKITTRENVLVYYDHGDPDDNEHVGRIRGYMDEALGDDGWITNIDIMIANINTDNVLSLIEVEEHGDNPKTILGDITSLLFCKKVMIRGKMEFEIDEDTMFIVGCIVQGREREKVPILEQACRQKFTGKHLTVRPFKGYEPLEEGIIELIGHQLK